MSFREAIKSVFLKYFDADGRACRSEFWFFVLFNLLVQAVIYIIVITTRAGSLWVLMPLYCLLVLIPWISVLIRRLHDTGRSGWAYLILWIPIIGIIFIMIWLCRDSQPGSNKYGSNPKDNAGDENQALISTEEQQG